MATGDAERRKIERNLHDGAQQHLVALAVNLRLAKDLVDDDPDSAAEMLEALGDAVKDTIQELRDLAHGIYPAAPHGQRPARGAAGGGQPAARWRSRWTPTASGATRSEVEAAVYFCCLEALQNAAKHAPEAHVELERGRDRRATCASRCTTTAPGSTSPRPRPATGT